MLWIDILFTFVVGAIGALVIVWLRLIGYLPRFWTTLEIENIEEQYRTYSECNIERHRDGTLTQPDVELERSKRSDIRRQRYQSFVVAASIYVILGAATSTLFNGFQAVNTFNEVTIAKVLLTGALWSSFYSFIFVRAEDSRLDPKRKETSQDITSQTESLTEKVKYLNLRLEETIDDYNSLVDEYNVLDERYNELTTKYTDMIDKIASTKIGK